MGRKLTQQEWIHNVESKYPGKYDFSLVNYTSAHDDVNIICKEHNSKFKIKAYSLYNGKTSCEYCKKKPSTVTKEIFLERAKKYSDFTFDLSTYNTLDSIIDITHTVCGNTYPKKAKEHLRSGSCPLCSDKTYKGLDNFIKEAKKLYGEKYTYELTKYVNNSTSLWVTCDVHGPIKKIPKDFLKGYDCKDCNKESEELRLKRQRDWIQFCNKKHNFKYSYNFVYYTTYDAEVDIVCPKHGIFPQKASNHRNGKGCPHCAKGNVSKPETNLVHWLRDTFNLSVIQTYRDTSKIGFKSLDIYIPSIQLAIEYNGIQFHHSSKGVSKFYDKTYKDLEYHLDKYNLCKEHNINLIHIFSNEDLDTWKSKLTSYIDNPSNYTITFDNVKRVVDNFTIYGISDIVEI